MAPAIGNAIATRWAAFALRSPLKPDKIVAALRP
jgi:hypothetical protein